MANNKPTLTDASGRHTVIREDDLTISYKGDLGSSTLTFSTAVEANAFWLAFATK